jgi:hypothetical protein
MSRRRPGKQMIEFICKCFMAIRGIFKLKNLCNFRAKIRPVQNLCKLFAAESVPGD